MRAGSALRPGSLIAPRTRRRLGWLTWIGIAVGGGAAVKVVGAISGGWAVALVAAAYAIVAVGTRYDSVLEAGPHPGRAALAERTGLLLAGVGLALTPAAVGPVAVTGTRAPGIEWAILVTTLTVAMAVGWVVWAGRRYTRHTLPTSTTATLTGALARYGRVRAIAWSFASIAVGATVNALGVHAAGLLATLLALAPTRLYLSDARRDLRTRANVTAALAGIWIVPGDASTNWSRAQAQAGFAPIRIAFDADGDITRITLPLPSEWDSSGEEKKLADIRARLARLGEHGAERWVIEWDFTTRNAVATPSRLPKFAPYPGSRQPWDKIPIGVTEDGSEACIDLGFAPHTLLAGPTGTGKSTVQRNILLHCLQHDFRLFLIDPKRVELGGWRKYQNVIAVAMSLEEGVEVVQGVRDEMMCRFDEMEAVGVNHFKQLASPPPPVLLMIDETYNFLAPEGVKTDEGRERDALHGRATALLGEVARLGRAAGVFICAATQRPDATVIKGEFKANLDARVAAGRMDSTPSGMVLDSDDATRLPKIKGRGILRMGGEQMEFQGYYAEADWYDKYLAGKVDIEPLAKPKPLPPAAPALLAKSPAVNAVSENGTVQAQPAAASGEGPAVGVPGHTLDDIGGYENAKSTLMETVGLALRDSEMAAAYRIRTGGVLLYGPPGTGKTYLAEGLAGSLGVGWIKVSVGDLTSQYVGQGVEKIRAAVDAAINAAPCILCIDEIDAVAGKRDDETSGEGRKNVNELLVQLDRLRNTSGVVVLATTNLVESIDSAVIRDGRFAERVRIDLPDREARVGILNAQLAGRPADEVDVEAVAEKTNGYTAAMLEAVVDGAARRAVRERRHITTGDLLAAVAERGGKDRPTREDDGLDSVVLPAKTEAELREVLALLTNPEKAKRFGIKPPTGMLLYGPPGTGKTSIAKAIAAEAKTSFYAVSSGEWTSKWQGEAEQRVRDVFARARENAPSVVFIDEIDAVAASREDSGSNPGASRIVNSLLAELDGFASSAAGDRGVFVIAATNVPDKLDPALLRPGRLSRSVEIGLPDEAGRLRLLERMTTAMPLADGVDLVDLAARTDGLSPADLRGVCERAALHAMQHADADSDEQVTASNFDAVLPVSPMTPEEWLAQHVSS